MVDQHSVFDVDISEGMPQKTQSGIFEILRPKQSLTENLKYISNYDPLEESLKQEPEAFGQCEQNVMEPA